MGGTLIDMARPAAKIPEGYSPPCFIDIDGTHILDYNKHTGVLTLNCDQVKCSDVEKAMLGVQKSAQGLEIHIHGIDAPVYFPRDTKIEYLHNGLRPIERLFQGMHSLLREYI
jgi:hypothetical protein